MHHTSLVAMLDTTASSFTLLLLLRQRQVDNNSNLQQQQQQQQQRPYYHNSNTRIAAKQHRMQQEPSPSPSSIRSLRHTTMTIRRQISFLLVWMTLAWPAHIQSIELPSASLIDTSNVGNDLLSDQENIYDEISLQRIHDDIRQHHDSLRGLRHRSSSSKSSGKGKSKLSSKSHGKGKRSSSKSHGKGKSSGSKSKGKGKHSSSKSSSGSLSRSSSRSSSLDVQPASSRECPFKCNCCPSEVNEKNRFLKDIVNASSHLGGVTRNLSHKSSRSDSRSRGKGKHSGSSKSGKGKRSGSSKSGKGKHSGSRSRSKSSSTSSRGAIRPPTSSSGVCHACCREQCSRGCGCTVDQIVCTGVSSDLPVPLSARTDLSRSRSGSESSSSSKSSGKRGKGVSSKSSSKGGKGGSKSSGKGGKGGKSHSKSSGKGTGRSGSKSSDRAPSRRSRGLHTSSSKSHSHSKSSGSKGSHKGSPSESSHSKSGSSSSKSSHSKSRSSSSKSSHSKSRSSSSKSSHSKSRSSSSRSSGSTDTRTNRDFIEECTCKCESGAATLPPPESPPRDPLGGRPGGSLPPTSDTNTPPTGAPDGSSPTPAPGKTPTDPLPPPAGPPTDPLGGNPGSLPTQAPEGSSPTPAPDGSPPTLPPAQGTETDPPTPPPVSAEGDPHFNTWSGQHFDFQGECDLLLVDNPTFKGGVGMHIHGRTKLYDTWSAFSSVSLRIGDDTFEIHGMDPPLINGVPIPLAAIEYGSEFLFPITVAGFSVTVQNKGPNSRRHIIHLGDGERIYMSNFKHFVDLEIEGPRESDFMGSSGLLGNFNARANLARDGKTVIEDTDSFGQEWQVIDSDPQLFTVVDGPQYPARCKMPAKLTAEERHLRAMSKKVSEDDAKKACSKATPSRIQNCIADVFGSDNIDMAGIYEVHL